MKRLLLLLSMLFLVACFRSEPQQPQCDAPTKGGQAPGLGGALPLPVSHVPMQLPGQDFSPVSLSRALPVKHLLFTHEGISLRVLHSRDFKVGRGARSMGEVVAFFEQDGTLLRVKLTDHAQLSERLVQRIRKWMGVLRNLPQGATLPALPRHGVGGRELRQLVNITKKVEYLRAIYEVNFLTGRELTV